MRGRPSRPGRSAWLPGWCGLPEYESPTRAARPELGFRAEREVDFQAVRKQEYPIDRGPGRQVPVVDRGEVLIHLSRPPMHDGVERVADREGQIDV